MEKKYFNEISEECFKLLEKKGRVDMPYNYMSGTRYMDGFLSSTILYPVLLSGRTRKIQLRREPGYTSYTLLCE